MFILRDLIKPIQSVFPDTENGRERFVWFAYTMVAILIPVTSARSSNLLRTLQSLFGLSMTQRRFYTFMASPKMPWQRIWHYLWERIPEPFTDNRLLLALDDSINPKTGKKIFACQRFFDHAAKDNQARYPWSQNIVTVGLLKSIRGRWC
ncbi:MAG: transposase, partial [Pseudomonadota bacterium]|nr:transposase [Pseudomonadota bacterium]